MKEISRIVLLGAGALGSYFASKFQTSSKFSTALVASGKRAEDLRSCGITVDGVKHSVEVAEPSGNQAPADLVIVALKHHQLADAAADLEDFVGPETIIISVMNGLSSEEFLGELYGREKLLCCVAVGMEAVRQNGMVSVPNPGRLCFGEADNRQVSNRVLKVQEALSHAGIFWETPADMVRMIWWKFMINVGMNQASAVLKAPYGVFQRSMNARSVVVMLMQEVIVLAKAANVDLKECDLQSWEKLLNSCSPRGRTSMLQDLDSGRKTEVEMFAGKVLELGREYGISTPANEIIFHQICALESITSPF